ncbi:MAG: sulfurtransferase-like selenium metabolism protein YedF [Oscillospiraceae bacterium]|nr:sulfurtransferase-like selenium metabolism protein YedF [Oscillospiraceae bacterium]
MMRVNAMGDACPIPVVKTKNAIQSLGEAGGMVETLVDNEIAVQNLMKMAQQKGYSVKSEKLGAGRFQVVMTVGPGAVEDSGLAECCIAPVSEGRNVVAAISSGTMGTGAEELGRTLLKGFLYALSQQDQLPRTILFYNGGASITCEGSASLEDLKSMEAQGVEILTCGTCLDFYGLKDQLRVGEVTNMYTIAEKLTGADLVVKP